MYKRHFRHVHNRAGLAFAVAGICLLGVSAGCGSSNPKTKEATADTAGGNMSTAPSGQMAANQKQALVRFVNGFPGESTTLSVAGQPSFSNVEYGNVTAYKEIPASGKDFALFTGAAAGNAPPVANANQGLDAGAHYTAVAAIDPNGAPKLFVVSDDLSAPSNGKAKLRLINASADQLKVVAPKQSKTGTKANTLFSGVDSASSKGYDEVDPISGTLNIEQDVSSGGMSGNRNSSANARPKQLAKIIQIPVQLEAGKEYTIVATGGTAKYPLKATMVEDQLIAPGTLNR